MTRHLAVSVEGLILRLSGMVPIEKWGAWQVFQDDSGRYLTKEEVFSLVVKAQKKGHKYISSCEYVDDEGRCKGHEE